MDYRHRRLQDWKPCSSLPTTESVRRLPGCGSGRKLHVRGTSSKSWNGSAPCASEKRIHRARYAAIAGKSALVSAQHLFDTARRLATLVVFAREMEAVLVDAALVMFEKMLGSVFRRADRAHRDNIVDRAKTLDAAARALFGMAKAMLAAKAKNEDQVATVERALGWERLKALVSEHEAVVADMRPDNLGEVVERYASVRRMSQVILGAFSFRSWKDNDPLLTALDVVRELHASGAKKLPPHPPTSFLRPVWRKVVKTAAGIDRRAYEVAVMMALRDRLQSGDVWVEGSRAFRAFDDFLLPRDAFETSRRAGELGLAVADRFEDWRDEKIEILEVRLREVDALAAAGEPSEASLTEEGLSISPIRASESEATETIARRLYAMLPRLRITELLAEVYAWKGFAPRTIFPLGSMADPEISRFPCKELACMPNSPTTPGHPSACANALEYIAFRYTDSVGARDWFSIAAQWPACTYPDRRFAGTLTDACARLGANADRYSFIAVDSHGRFRVKWSGSSAHQKTPVAVSVSKV